MQGAVATDRKRVVESIKDISAGTLAGVACLYSGHPCDTVKVRLQLDNTGRYKGALDCFWKMGKEEGVKSLFKGATPTLLSMMMENGILFLAYNHIKTGLQSLRENDYRFGQQQRNSNISTTGNSHDLSLWELSLAGSLSSFFSSFALCPTELIKCRLQADNTYKGPVDCTIKTIRKEGVSGLFRGLSSTLFREMPGNFAFFGAYEAMRMLLTPKNKTVNDLQVPQLVLAGGLGGVAFWLTVYPVDVVKSHQQTEQSSRMNRSFLRTLVHIYQTQGVTNGLYRGVGITLFRAFPSNAALFVTYEYSKKLMDKM